MFEIFNRYINEEKNNTESTKALKRKHLKVIQKFVWQYKKNAAATLFFGEVSLATIKALDQYMASRLSPGTASDIHAFTRRLFRRAVKDGYIGSNPYDQFDIVFYDDDKRQALTSEQLKHLEEIDRSQLSKLHIKETIVDMFLFACYTGLRYSDVITITREHLHKDVRGYVLQKKTIKTGIDVTLPLYSLFNGKPQEILEKYIHNEDTETIFPQVQKTTMMVNLRRLGQALSLPFTLTFHVSRHTCASQLAERVDNPFIIMNVLGHGKIDTSMRYIHTSHRTAAKKLENINWKNELTPEEMAQSDANIAQVSDALYDVCQRKNLSNVLTNLALGFAVCNLDKSPMIIEWIGKIRKTDYTEESFEKRLEMVVEM